MKTPAELLNDFTERCTACGACAAMCPPFSCRASVITHREVQEELKGFLGGGPATGAVVERSRLCDECYLCTIDTCPEGLDPMRTNQLLRGLLNQDGAAPLPFIPPDDQQADERVIAALLTTFEEFQRITTPDTRGDGRTLFFAGCNVYYQPHLLLTALVVLERISGNWTLLPGLDRCCGGNYDTAGRLTAGTGAMEDLLRRVESADVESVVVWCPTCLTRLSRAKPQVPIMHFTRFVSDHLDGGHAGSGIPGSITLHEACKVGYLDIDASAPGDLLHKLTGGPVLGMKRQGRQTVCCGWSLRQHLPETWQKHRQGRLDEAAGTGARTLVTVCHGCQWNLDAQVGEGPVGVANYIQLVGDAMGISHPDRAKRLRFCKDADSALEMLREEPWAEPDRLPFTQGIIREALTRLLPVDP